MRSPVFVICQGRTGGTMFSDLLARLPRTRYLIEPLHPRLLSNVQKQPAATQGKLGHDTILPYPNRGYRPYPFKDLVELHAGQHSRDITVCTWLRYLVDGAHKDGEVPVFKICRLFGRLHLLRQEFPDAAIIHLWRDLASQRASYRRLGWPGDYFGDCSGYGLAPSEYTKAWQLAQDEARPLADVSISYQVLCSMPRCTLHYVLRDALGMSVEEAEGYAVELCTLVRRPA